MSDAHTIGPALKFNTPVGRTNESKILRNVVDRQGEESPLIVLHGKAGSGKSSLLHGQPWKENGWILATGKFEEHRSTEPFSAIIDAMDQLITRWIEHDKDAAKSQMGELCSLLEEDMEILKHILPQAFTTTGACMKQKTTTKHKPMEPIESTLAGIEAVSASFARTLDFLCSSKPVLLFLDDIHWTDKASLNVFKTLVTSSQVDGLVLAMSYRDDEVHDEHPVALSMKEVEKKELDTITVHLQDLAVGSVNDLVASVTQRDHDSTLPLAEVIHSKTAGNPFFTIQFMRMLHREGFLKYSLTSFRWEWGNVEELQVMTHVSDNVADVVASAIHTLPEETQIVLKVSSCLGKIVPLHVLLEYFISMVTETEAEEGQLSCPALFQIEKAGLQRVLEFAVDMDILIKNTSDAYMWSHDRLQSVAYSLIPEPTRPELHMKLGKLLQKMSVTDTGEEWMIFMAANQLNRFSDLQLEKGLGVEVARLSLEAAKLSIAKSALYPGYEMLTAGTKHLNESNRWHMHYDLYLEIYTLLGETAIQIGRRDEAMEAVEEVLEHARELGDKFRVQCVMLKCVVSGKTRDYKLGAQKAKEILKMYGETIPNTFLSGQIFLENRKLRSILPGGKLEGLLDLPRMEDEQSYKVVKLLVTYLSKFVHLLHADRSVASYAASRALSISCSKGVCPETAHAVVQVGFLLRLNGNFKEACEYANFGVKLIKMFPQHLGSIHATVLATAEAVVFPGARPFNDTLDGLLESHHIALRTGDTEKAISAILAYAIAYLAVGLPLGPLESDLASYAQETRILGLPYAMEALFYIFRQTVLNLQKTVDNPTILKGEALDQDKELAKFEGPGRRMTLRDINASRINLACIYNDWETAEALVRELESFLKGDGLICRAHHRNTYLGLAAIKIGREKGKKYFKSLGQKMIKLFKKDVKKGSVNSHPVLTMFQAEERPSKANYDHAIKTCARLGLIHHEAYMCERAGLFFRDQGDEGWAEFYLSQAYQLYSDWGAFGKTEKMKIEYSSILKTLGFDESKRSSALRGRSRYSSVYSDQLKQVSWSSRRSSMEDSPSVSTGETSLPISLDISYRSVDTLRSNDSSSGGLLYGPPPGGADDNKNNPHWESI